jgi:hypothetical protein
MQRWVRFARFVGLAAALSAGLCLIGWPLTKRWSGDPGIPAMMLGCAVSLAAAAAAGLLVALMPGGSPMDRMKRAMLAMLVRLGVVVVLGTLAVIDGAFATSPLLVWMAVAYAALLPLEVRFALA